MRNEGERGKVSARERVRMRVRVRVRARLRVRAVDQIEWPR